MPITINGSTGISGVDGSAGTPALIGSDADTGIFLAAGQVSASVNGTAANVPLVSGTAQASTSGTSIDFTGIPSWVKRVTVMFNGVSTNGVTALLCQLGTSSGVTTSGYTGQYNFYSQATSSAGGSLSTGFWSAHNAAAGLSYGSIVLYNINGNTWMCSSNTSMTVSGYNTQTNGIIALSATLDRIRITTVNGTDTFDAGSINIMYE